MNGKSETKGKWDNPMSHTISIPLERKWSSWDKNTLLYRGHV